MSARPDLGIKLAAAAALATAAIAAAGAAWALSNGGETPVARSYALAPPAPEKQTAQDALAKSLGCTSCHTATDHTTMHVNPGVILGRTGWRGGGGRVVKPQTAAPKDESYRAATDSAH